MKSLVLGILMAASVGAFATDASTDASVDRTPVVATVKGGRLDMEIDQIALLADGRLQLIAENKKVQTVDLPEAVTRELLGKALGLSNVKVKKVGSGRVCRHEPPPQLSNLSVSGYNSAAQKFNSVLRLILSDRGCHVANQYFPEDEELYRLAEGFREQLVILTLNYSK